MNTLDITEVIEYVKNNISTFHKKRIDRLNTLNLNKLLKKKNPYLFKAKSVLTAEQIVTGLLDAFISSNEETIFGDWLEGLAIFINQKVFNGYKSGISGIDLEFNKNDIRYIVAIKSGPNWGNSSQIKKMITDFNTARKTLRTSNSNMNIVAVNGCCYGIDKNPEKISNYYKYCGQIFWEFISGEENLYLDIIEPIGFKARQKNDEFLESYSKIINKFTMEFIENFCNNDFTINWQKLVKFNSSIMEKVK